MVAKRPPGRPKVKPDGLWTPRWRCSSCGEFKYETAFHRKNHGPYALRKVQTYCKDCIANYQHARQMERRMRQVHDDAG